MATKWRRCSPRCNKHGRPARRRRSSPIPLRAKGCPSWRTSTFGTAACRPMTSSARRCPSSRTLPLSHRAPDMALPLGAALRQTLGETLTELAAEDPRVLVLDGDVGSSTGGAIFEAAHPDRYLQTGPAEQNMLAMAAGLATMGFQPY